MIFSILIYSLFTRQSKKEKKSPLTWWKNPSWSSFWKSYWTVCVCWKAASENAREGKSADWLSSVHCCSDWLCQAGLWGPWSRWSALRGALSPPHSSPPFTSATPCPQTCLASAASSQSGGVFPPPIAELRGSGHIGVSQWTTPVSLEHDYPCQS